MSNRDVRFYGVQRSERLLKSMFLMNKEGYKPRYNILGIYDLYRAHVEMMISNMGKNTAILVVWFRNVSFAL